jgi:hypothetical protein
MMAGFTEGALSKKLADLNSSQQSIQTLSLWLIHHRKHHATIVKVWFRELQKGKPAVYLIQCVYLRVNTIIFNRCTMILSKNLYLMTASTLHQYFVKTVKKHAHQRNKINVFGDPIPHVAI